MCVQLCQLSIDVSASNVTLPHNSNQRALPVWRSAEILQAKFATSILYMSPDGVAYV